MWWLIPIIIGGVIWLDAEETNARKSLQKSYNSCTKEITKQRKQVEQHLINANNQANFHSLMSSYRTSIKLADKSYLLLKDARKSVKGIYKAIGHASRRLNELFTLKKDKKTTKIERVNINREITLILNTRKLMLADKQKLRSELELLLEEVRKLNFQTKTVKLTIRDKCGHGGRLWFKKSESRKLLRFNG